MWICRGIELALGQLGKLELLLDERSFLLYEGVMQVVAEVAMQVVMWL